MSAGDVQNKILNCTFCREKLQTQRREPVITTAFPDIAWVTVCVVLCEQE